MYVPSWFPHSHAGPRSTLAPGKIPLASNSTEPCLLPILVGYNRDYNRHCTIYLGVDKNIILKIYKLQAAFHWNQGIIDFTVTETFQRNLNRQSFAGANVPS